MCALQTRAATLRPTAHAQLTVVLDAVPRQDAALQLVGLGGRLDAQLVHQAAPALQVLPQRVCAASRAGVRDHEAAMPALAERIERNQAAGGLDGSGVVTARELRVHEQTEDGAVAVEQRLAPRDRPIG